MFRLFELSILLFTLLILTSNGAVIQKLYARDTDGITVTVKDESLFCSFLPRDYGGNIGESEDTAVAFCTQSSPDAPGARIFPDRFIRSAHYLATHDYVQITGTIHRDAYGLSPDDGGGQYDNAGDGAPPGSICHGYKKYVNLVEPDIERFCIRCCSDTSKCDTSHSNLGCEHVIPGNYT